MEEPESNTPKEQPEEKGFGNFPKSKFTDREKLNNELREAISKMTRKEKVRNKNIEPNME